MDRFPELQILISEKKKESSFIHKEEALERGLLFCWPGGGTGPRAAYTVDTSVSLHSPPTLPEWVWASQMKERTALFIIICARRAPPPFEPSEPYEPSEPSHRRCVHWCPPPLVISSGAACRYGADGNRSHDTLSREISLRNAARTIRGGDFSTLWRLCIESPSQPKLASSLHNKRLSYWRLTGFGRNDDRGAANTVISSGAACRYGGQRENALMIR